MKLRIEINVPDALYNSIPSREAMADTLDGIARQLRHGNAEKYRAESQTDDSIKTVEWDVSEY
jgi:hypothetical protein